jgi:hypothetical protein
MNPTTLIALAVFLFIHLLSSTSASATPSYHSIEAKYTKAHNLGHSYTFHPGDGWETITISHSSSKNDDTRPAGNGEILEDHRTKRSAFSGLSKVVAKAMSTLRGIGKPSPVIITW